MRNFTITTLLVIGLASPVFAQGAYSSSGGSMAQSAGAPVMGTIISVDPKANSLTITESSSGAEQTFSGAPKSDLRDLKAGDKVKISPNQSDPSKAQNVQKQ